MRESLRRRLESFAERVASRYGRALVIVFGSRVRGEDYASSDTDILVALDRPTLEDLVWLAREARSSGVPSPEIHLYSFERLEEFEGNPVVMDAVLEGVPLVDTEGLADRLKRSVSQYAREKDIVRTRTGWWPSRHAGD